MKLERIYRALYGEPMLVTRSAHAAFRAMLDAHVRGAVIPQEAVSAVAPKVNVAPKVKKIGREAECPKCKTMFDFDSQPETSMGCVDCPKCGGPVTQKNLVEDDEEDCGFTLHGDTALISVCGPIGKRLSAWDRDCYGACDVDDVSRATDAALIDTRVSQIVYVFDSPGGTVTGVPECGAVIEQADALKPCYAFTDTMACSAAYWLASQCRGIYTTPSAITGSIGVYCYLLDESEAYAKEGLRPIVISTGPNKGAGLPGMEWTEAQLAEIQADVDQLRDWFFMAVKSRRPQADEESFTGECFRAEDAKKRGLIDGIAGSLGEVLKAISYQ